MLIVEVKTQIVDVQEMLSTFDRKRRVVPAAVSTGLGWRPNLMGWLLVLPEETRVRDAVARHAEVFAAAFPSRNVEIKRWFHDPATSIAGIWFLRYSNGGNLMRAGGGVSRVRRRSGGQLRLRPRSGAGHRTPSGLPVEVEDARTTS